MDDRTGNLSAVSIALGTFFGSFPGFSIGATACTLVVAVLLLDNSS